MKNFDVGVLNVSYDKAGELITQAQIVRDNPAGGVETLTIDRARLLALVQSDLVVYKTGFIDIHAYNTNILATMQADPYPLLCRVWLIDVAGKTYLKATGDTTACDDFG
ncbi:MAG: hypothetical protein AB9897_01250 [Anaerolineaceae bacterium]